MNALYATRKVFGVQLYKNNARALLSRILCILNSDWLQHARSIRGVYELLLLLILLLLLLLLLIVLFSTIILAYDVLLRSQ